MRRALVTILLTLLGWLECPQTGWADYVFTSQPIDGQVLSFWIGMNPTNGSGTLSVDLKNPENPGLFMAGTTGRHILRLGMNLNGEGILPDLNSEGELPELIGGNPASYTFSYLNGAIRLRFEATTSPDGQLLEDTAFDSYSQPQPGFPTAGWTTFLVTGRGVSSDFEVTVFDTSGSVGILSENPGRRVIWNEPVEVAPVAVKTPEPGSVVLLGMGALAWFGFRRRPDSR